MSSQQRLLLLRLTIQAAARAATATPLIFSPESGSSTHRRAVDECPWSIDACSV